MNRIVKHICLILLLAGLFPLHSFCQKNHADSLENMLQFAASDTEKVNILNRAITYYYTNEEYKEGIPDAMKALTIALKVNQPERIAYAEFMLSRLYTGNAQSDSALRYAKLAETYYLTKAKKSDLDQFYRNMGAIYALALNYPVAIDYYKKAIETAEIAKDSIAIHSGFYAIAGIYDRNGEYEQAIDYYNKALQASLKYKVYHNVMRDYVDIANVRARQGIYPPSLQAYLEALKVNDEHGGPNKDRTAAIIYANMASVYNSINDTAMAMKYNNYALKIFEKFKEPEKEAIMLGNIGNLYMEAGDYKRAEYYATKSFEMFLELKDQQHLGLCYTNLGELYYRIKQYDKALDYYNKGLDILREAGNAEEETYTLSGLAKLFMDKGEYDKAEKYGVEGFEIASSTNLIKEVKDLGQILSELYEKQGNGNKALYYYKQYVAAKDSMDNKDNSRKMIRAELNYKYEKEQQAEKLIDEKKDAVNIEKARHDRVIRNLYLGGFIIVFLLTIMLLRNFIRVRRANKTISEQKMVVEQKNRDITDSINYAKRIQQAMLPTIQVWNNSFKQSFIYYKPKDIVSGDFYWCMPVGNDIIVAVADCTGHGVPGAFMSMLGISSLNKIVGEKGIKQPAEILNNLRDEIVKSLNPEGKMEEVKDGMDMTLCYISKDKGILEYAAANNPLLIIRKEGDTYRAIESEADKMPVGKYFEEGKQFASYKTDIKKGDRIYMFTDGYVDQFGGDKGKKFKYRQLVNLLVKCQSENMTAQKETLNKTMEAWKGNLDQVDDMLIAGIEIV